MHIDKSETYEILLISNVQYNRSAIERSKLISSVSCKSNIFSQSISVCGEVDKAFTAFTAEAVDCGSITGRIKLKIIKLGIHSFPT